MFLNKTRPSKRRTEAMKINTPVSRRAQQGFRYNQEILGFNFRVRKVHGQQPPDHQKMKERLGKAAGF